MTRWLDLVALAIAFPIFVLAELPLAGYALGGGVWLAQRALQLFFERRAAAAGTPRAVVGYAAGGAIARGWGSALAVLTIGTLVGDDAGLAAVVLILALFTVYFATGVISRFAAQS